MASTLTFREAKITMDGGVWLCVKVNEPAPARSFVYGLKDRLYDCELKEHREKRSLDANAYLWVLLEKMADALRVTKEELYIEYIRSYGVCKDFTLTEDEAKTFRVAWSRQGIGWPTERMDYTPDGERLIIRAYYGSSQYSTKRMARLIDAVVEDCKELGIETLPPDKLAAMKEAWGHEQA